jgi:hypothetical protein
MGHPATRVAGAAADETLAANVKQMELWKERPTSGPRSFWQRRFYDFATRLPKA